VILHTTDSPLQTSCKQLVTAPGFWEASYIHRSTVYLMPARVSSFNTLPWRMGTSDAEPEFLYVASDTLRSPRRPWASASLLGDANS